jgi:AcrR family transcriptional regulator
VQAHRRRDIGSAGHIGAADPHPSGRALLHGTAAGWLIYRHFPSKDALLQAIVDDGLARFSTLSPSPEADHHDVPLHEVLLGLGRAFLAGVDEQRDLIRLLISQQHLLGADTRFVRFIDTAAAGLGEMIDHHLPDPDGEGRGRGYLLARGYMSSLVALSLLQHGLGLEAMHPVDPGAYLQIMVSTLTAGLTAADHVPRGRES